jgi:hypothetical protein
VVGDVAVLGVMDEHQHEKEHQHEEEEMEVPGAKQFSMLCSVSLEG